MCNRTAYLNDVEGKVWAELSAVEYKTPWLFAVWTPVEMPAQVRELLDLHETYVNDQLFGQLDRIDERLLSIPIFVRWPDGTTLPVKELQKNENCLCIRVDGTACCMKDARQSAGDE